MVDVLEIVEQMQRRSIRGFSRWDRRFVLGTWIDNVTRDRLLAELETGFVVTPNVNHVVRLQRDRAFREAYESADYYLCDSQILRYAALFLGQPIREKISGSAFLSDFYRYHAKNPDIQIFLLGAREGVAARAQQLINQRVDREIVVDTYSPPPGFEYDRLECQHICDRIRRSGATVLVLGLGTPKQEKWFCQYRSQLPERLKLTFAFGCAIDLEAGYKPRSPEWASAIGLEWLVRLVREPRRLWRRYVFDMMPFGQLVWREWRGRF